MTNQFVVLSFHDTLLHQADVDLLTGPHWLNDTIISFYFEYLEKVTFSTANDLLFVSPEVTQCIKMVNTDEIGIFLDPLGIERKNFVFFALNDNSEAESVGGNHWSLLVYSKPEKSFFHLDSASGSNDGVARHFARHLTPYLSGTGEISFVSKSCTQQDNGYDCGVHVCLNTELLANHVRKHGDVASCDTQDPVCCSEMRKRILRIVQALASKT